MAEVRAAQVSASMSSACRGILLLTALICVMIWAVGCGDRADGGAAETAVATTVGAGPAFPVSQPIGEPEATPGPEVSEDLSGFQPNRESMFLGEPDWAMRASLASSPVANIEKGRGGRSLAFKITLEDGTKGYYKPEQSFSAAHYYAELASYYLDRELGLGRVPPTVGRSLPWEPFRALSMNDRRRHEVSVEDDGTVRGAFIGWVTGGLEAIEPGHGWERWIRVQGSMLLTPYQRPNGWRDDMRRLRNGETLPDRQGARAEDEADTPERAAELSDMILFDYLATNVDRWGGDFTNVRTRGPGGPLIYLDNGAGFTPGPRARIGLMDARLHGLQRFRARTVERIRALDRPALTRRMENDPLAPFFNTKQFEQLMERRAHLLEHVAAMQARFGEAATPW